MGEVNEMKILVLGATGMAGHTIYLYLKSANYNVTAFSKSKFNGSHSIVGDATNFKYLKKLIIEGDYDAVINAVGILNSQAEAYKSTAVILNSYLPHFLSELTQNMKTKIIHMSTDCVFSGKRGGYIETSFKDGETFYDRTKALGELEDNKNLTFRNSIIGPDLNPEGIGLFNWFMKQKGEIKGYSQAIWTGVTTLTLAKAMEQALIEDLTGLYHLVNGESINKFDLLQLFNKHLKENANLIVPDNRLSLDKSLINNREDFSFVVPSYEEMIMEMKEWILNNKVLYPHYFIGG